MKIEKKKAKRVISWANGNRGIRCSNKKKKIPNVRRSSVTVFMTCWEKKSKKGRGEKKRNEFEVWRVFFLSLSIPPHEWEWHRAWFPRGFSYPWAWLGALLASCADPRGSAGGKVDGPGDEKPNHIFKPAQGRISSLSLGNIKPFFGLLAPGLSQPSGRGLELWKSWKYLEKKPWNSQQGAADPFFVCLKALPAQEPIREGCKSRGMHCPSF